jgi:hypothetical protein
MKIINNVLYLPPLLNDYQRRTESFGCQLFVNLIKYAQSRDADGMNITINASVRLARDLPSEVIKPFIRILATGLEENQGDL